MAVTSVKEIFSGRRGGDTIDRKRSYIRVFEVITDDPEDDAYTAGAGTGVPRNGEPHPSDEMAVMIDIDASQSDEDFTLWYVTCNYSSDYAGEQQQEALSYDGQYPGENVGATTGSGGGQAVRDPDPRNRPAVWRITGETVLEVFEEERGGDAEAIVNSAGDPFDPPLMAERSYAAITITKNVDLGSPILDLTVQGEYRDSVNLDEYRGYDVGTLRVTQLDIESAVENDIAYAVVTATIKIRPDGWKKRVLDRGFNEKFGPSGLFPEGYWRRIKDPVTGEYATEPALLDGNGQRLAADADPVFLEFDVYLYKTFATLFGWLGL